MTKQEMDRMNDYLQDQMLEAYERQQEQDYDAMVNEEPPYDEGIEEYLYYREDPYTLTLPTDKERLEEFMYNKATHD